MMGSRREASLLESFRRKRSLLDWVKFVLFLMVFWSVAVGLIIAASFHIPQTRTEWILLVALGPPAWMLVEFSMELFRRSRFYQVTIRGMPMYVRILLGVILALGLMLSWYSVFWACAWVLSEL